jgi:hypothetical protein
MVILRKTRRVPGAGSWHLRGLGPEGKGKRQRQRQRQRQKATATATATAPIRRLAFPGKTLETLRFGGAAVGGFGLSIGGWWDGDCGGYGGAAAIRMDFQAAAQLADSLAHSAEAYAYRVAGGDL